MAITTISDVKLYNEEFWAGFTERLDQNIALFNGQSYNAIQLVSQTLLGQYAKRSFMQKIANGGVSRRDPTSTAAATAIKWAAGEQVSVKLDRKCGPYSFTLDSLRKIGVSMEEISMLLGMQIAEGITADYLNTALRALVAAIANVAAMNIDATAESVPTLKTSNIKNALKLMGDRTNAIRCFVMHSTPFYDLVGDQMENYQFDTVAGFTIATGLPIAMGRPILVTDSSDLIATTPDPDEYYTLGLVEGAATVIESEARDYASEVQVGLENLVSNFQLEHAFNLELGGFSWDVANGAANPNDATLSTGSNWDKCVTSNKDLAGVLITSN